MDITTLEKALSYIKDQTAIAISRGLYGGDDDIYTFTRSDGYEESFSDPNEIINYAQGIKMRYDLFAR